MTSALDRAALETGPAFTPRFDEAGLIPVVVQEAGSGAVLMVAWMNAEALQLTISTGKAWYWSRSRQALWRKGETSGHIQSVESLSIDCDQDTILLTVRQTGPACHTGAATCFYRRLDVARGTLETIGSPL